MAWRVNEKDVKMPCLLDSPGLGVQDPESLVLGDGEQRGTGIIELYTPQVLLGYLQLLLQLIRLVGIAAKILLNPTI